MEMRFEWDSEKAQTNLRKHGVAFEDAVRVWSDPCRIERIDTRFEEERWQTIGMIGGQLLLLVANTSQSKDGLEVIRIISARRAEKSERKAYEQ
jgi:uncharacterized DUF497 family protein